MFNNVIMIVNMIVLLHCANIVGLKILAFFSELALHDLHYYFMSKCFSEFQIYFAKQEAVDISEIGLSLLSSAPA